MFVQLRKALPLGRTGSLYRFANRVLIVTASTDAAEQVAHLSHYNVDVTETENGWMVIELFVGTAIT